MDGAETVGVPEQRRTSVPAGGGLPRGVAQVRPEDPAAVLMVDLQARQVLYANAVAAQMAPGLSLPVSADEWSSAADLRDIDGEPLDETGHPLSRIARFEPVAGQGVSAARSSDLAERREPLWVVALPLDEAPNLRGHALVVFLPVRDREQLQERAESAHARSSDVDGGSGASVSASAPGPGDAAAVREAAVLATGLSFTVADARAPDMPLVWVNPAFTAVTGYTFQRAVGYNCRFLQGPGTDTAVTARMRAALETGESTTETLLNFRADGTAFWNQVAMSPILDAAGQVTHYVGVQTDVSGRVAADAERDRALAAEQSARTAAEQAQARAERARADAETAHNRLQLLAEVTRQLSEVVDPEQALDRLALLVVPVLADFAMLAVVGDDIVAPSTASPAPAAGGGHESIVEQVVVQAGRHGLRDVAWWHHDPQMRPAVSDLARTRLTSLNETGRSTLVRLLSRQARTTTGVEGLQDGGGHGAGDVGQGGTGADGSGADGSGAAVPAVVDRLAASLRPGTARDSLLRLAPTSMVTWALRSRGRTLGLMTVGTGPGRAPLDVADVALGADIASRAGLALDRARLFRQQRDLAEGLQRSLLQLSPNAAPAHVQVAVRYVAAAEAAQVGGDFYDVFTQPGGAAVAVIGDVMGHDTQAAAAMAQLRSIVRTLGMVGDDGPANVLTRADEVMRASGVDITATATIVRISPGTHGWTDPNDARPPGTALLEWSNAGHPPPLVLHADARVTLLQASSTDLLMGVDPAARRQHSQVHLAAGMVLLLYTDGLVERRGQSLSEGIEKLQRVLQDAAVHRQDLEQLVDAVLDGMLPAAAADDVAVVAIRMR